MTNTHEVGAPGVDREPLGNFIQEARAIGDAAALVAAILRTAPAAARATACAVAIRGPAGVEVQVQGVSKLILDRYLAFTASHADPVRAALATHAGVVRTREVFPEGSWREHPFYQQVLEPFGLTELMAVEVSNVHGPCGVLAVARSGAQDTFSLHEALRLEIMCLHASVAIARLNAAGPHEGLRDHLTAKQQQLTDLVAHGLTNEQIAHACGVTVHAVKKSLERMFARFHVSSRTELIATLGVRKPPMHAPQSSPSSSHRSHRTGARGACAARARRLLEGPHTL
ncbi:MAG: helix-turn-helix transcriptional regulator [Kofleriaceae bacterium]